MKRTKGKFLREDSAEKKTQKAKTAAIVFSILAAVLVLIAALIAVFIWYSGSVRGSMFASHGSISATIPQSTAVDSAGAAPVEASTPISADWIDENGAAYNYRDDIISILLMGIDYMDDERKWNNETISNGGNADVLALVILNTETFEFSILYIPRDTITDVIAMDAQGNYIDTLRTNISTAHSYGDGGELSCRLTAEAVSQLLHGIPVNRYVSLDYDALYALNSIIGGLKVTFPEDYTFFDSSYTAGNTVTMNDLQLRVFMTYRSITDVEGAYIRGVRNMIVIRAMFDQCKDEIAANPTVALEFLNQLSSYLTTDLEISEITFLAQNIGKMNFGSDTVIKLPGESVMGEEYAEFHSDEQWLHDFVVDTFCVPAA